MDEARSVETPLGFAFTAEGHATRLLTKMSSLRKDHHLCDVRLKMGSKEILAHRVVLSACGNYFCAMFTNKMLESKQECIMLGELDEIAVQDLVDFA